MLPLARRRVSVPTAVISSAVLVAGALALALPAAPPAPRLAEAATTYAVSGGSVSVAGHGYGHGRGMSQYGARGAALSGLSAGQILDFYYEGTGTATLPQRNIRVLLSDEGTDVLVLPANDMAVVDAATGSRQLLPPGPTQWRIVSLPSGRLQVQANVPGSGWNGFAVGGQDTLTGPVHFTGTEFVKVVLPGPVVRGYRAEVIAYPDGAGRVQTVNLLPFEDYLRGVVPRESPSSWPAAALQAQAVAARSYSENKRARSTAANYDICDTTACQVYAGARTYALDGTQTGSVETASTDAAIAATALQVRTYAGAVILAEFSSSNGGHTASGSTAYFVAKPDPYEAAGSNPNASWTASIPVASLQSAFPAVGTLTGITIENRYGGGEWGGRVGDVVLRGIDGSGRATAVPTTGATIRRVGGLKSTYFTFLGSELGNPRGSVDVVGPDRSYSGQVTVRGWTIDDDAPTTPTEVHVYVDGRGVLATRADQPRPDVAAAFPDAGEAHGYAATIGLAAGTREVCIFAINIGPGENKLLRCTTVTVLDASPAGSLDGVDPATTSGAVTVRGWAYDPSEPAQAIAVHVYVDGRGAANVSADLARPDVANAYPAAGENHGFAVPLSLALGKHSVCVFAINISAGSNKLLRCSTVTVLAPSPTGSVDAVTPATSNDGRVTVRGWAFDPDQPAAALEVHVYVDGRGYGAYSTGVARPDVARIYPGVGGQQGWSVPVQLGLGSHQVCVFAINVAAGSNTLLGCVTATVSDRSPFGSVDSVRPSAPGQATVRGWTIDPDTLTTPTEVHVYVDGRGAGAFVANASRPDVAAAYPGAGSAHGFAVPVTPGPGSHQVCVFAISTGHIASPLLMRCVTVTL